MNTTDAADRRLGFRSLSLQLLFVAASPNSAMWAAATICSRIIPSLPAFPYLVEELDPRKGA
eukprot:gene3885-2977_t